MEVLSTPTSPPLDSKDKNGRRPYEYEHCFFSAPTSPARDPIDYKDNVIPLPRKARIKEGEDGCSNINYDHIPQDFEFEFFQCQLLDKTSPLSADELFYKGKIRPLMNIPSLSPYDDDSLLDVHDHSSNAEDIKNKNQESFVQELRKSRGRDRVMSRGNSISSSRKLGTRSLSPMRVSDIMLEPESEPDPKENPESGVAFTTRYKNAKHSLLSSISFSKRHHKKWSLRDLLLFRSASEGSDDSRVNKITSKEGFKGFSFRGSSGKSKRTGGEGAAVSAHEVHYTANRAVSGEMKRKTYLPYKQGLLGCFGANEEELNRRNGFLPRG